MEPMEHQREEQLQSWHQAWDRLYMGASSWWASTYYPQAFTKTTTHSSAHTHPRISAPPFVQIQPRYSSNHNCNSSIRHLTLRGIWYFPIRERRTYWNSSRLWQGQRSPLTMDKSISAFSDRGGGQVGESIPVFGGEEGLNEPFWMTQLPLPNERQSSDGSILFLRLSSQMVL